MQLPLIPVFFLPLSRFHHVQFGVANFDRVHGDAQTVGPPERHVPFLRFGREIQYHARSASATAPSSAVRVVRCVRREIEINHVS